MIQNVHYDTLSRASDRGNNMALMRSCSGFIEGAHVLMNLMLRDCGKIAGLIFRILLRHVYLRHREILGDEIVNASDVEICLCNSAVIRALVSFICYYLHDKDTCLSLFHLNGWTTNCPPMLKLPYGKDGSIKNQLLDALKRPLPRPLLSIIHSMYDDSDKFMPDELI